MASPISLLTSHISWALTTLGYVKKKLFLGAANKPRDFLVSGGRSMSCAIGSYRDLKSLNLKDWPSYVANQAALAERDGCGNCGPHAAVAFQYLKRQGVSPIDYMMYASGDHCFVVIGRAASSKAADYKTWGPDAVVCDPWGGVVCAASEIPKSRMYRGWEGGFVSRVRA